jgi:hypothetical protein
MNQSVKILILIVVIILILLIAARWNTSTSAPIVVGKKKKDKRLIVLKLLPPQDIQVKNDNGTVTVNWREPQGAKSYILYYSDKPNPTAATARTIGSITGNEFVISKVPAGRYYCYMTSISGARESEPSPTVQFDVEVCTLPEPPEDFTSRVLSVMPSAAKVLLSWKAETTLDGYVIRLSYEHPPVGDDSDHLITRIDDPETANHIMDGLDRNVQWYATISSLASHCGEGRMSAPLKLN